MKLSKTANKAKQNRRKKRGWISLLLGDLPPLLWTFFDIQYKGSRTL